MIFALLIIVQVALGVFTRHGQEVPVPDFYSMSLEEAEKVASKDRLRLDVTDSVYVGDIELGAVYSQNPMAGQMVKKGRRILITINSTQIKTSPMPSLVGLSLRGAITEIVSRGFKVGKLEFVTDMATNYVLEQKIGRRRVRQGDMVPAGSAVTLVIGVNPDEDYTFVPQLRGLNLAAASELIFDNSLNLGAVKYDASVLSDADKSEALVYSQSPASSASGSFPRGTKVTLYMTIDSAKLKPVVDTLAATL